MHKCPVHHTVRSSRRSKDDIRDMGDASGGLLRLRPVTFRYKQKAADGSAPIRYGLIAEEVAEVYPELVVYDGEGRVETGGVAASLSAIGIPCTRAQAG